MAQISDDKVLSTLKELYAAADDVDADAMFDRFFADHVAGNKEAIALRTRSLLLSQPNQRHRVL